MDNYGQLKAEIANWIDREDQTANIPLWIRLAEAEIYRQLRCRENEFVAIVTQTTYEIVGQPQVTPATVGIHKTLPSNYKEMKDIYWNDTPLREVPETTLVNMARSGYNRLVSVYAEVARTLRYDIDIPDDPATWEENDVLRFTYYGTESLDSLPTWQVPTNPVEDPAVEDTDPEAIAQSDDNTTRMFQQYPNLYLAGGLKYAQKFLKSMRGKGMTDWTSEFNKEMALIDTESGEITGSVAEVSSVYGDDGGSYHAY